MDEQVCRQCAGLCCQGHPGVWVDPRRFAAIFFPEKTLSLPLLLEQSQRLELELRRVGGIPLPAPRRSPAGCVFLAGSGCRLEPARRPCQCLALIPAIDTLIDGEIRCRLPAGYDTGQASKRWERFWKQAPSS